MDTYILTKLQQQSDLFEVGGNLSVMQHKILQLHPQDNLIAALQPLKKGETYRVGGRDVTLTVDIAAKHKFAALPHSEHVVIRDAGHLVMLEHPTVVSAQFLALIDRAVAARALSGTATHGRLRRMVTDVARRRRVAAVAQKAPAR